jgi:hypothetical protein
MWYISKINIIDVHIFHLKEDVSKYHLVKIFILGLLNFKNIHSYTFKICSKKFEKIAKI